MENMEIKNIPTIFTDKLFRYITITFLFIALLNRMPGLTILAILVLSFIYGAKIWSKAGIYKIFLSFNVESKKLFPGEDIFLSLIVENRKLLPVWLQIVFNSSVAHSFNLNSIKESSLLWFQKVKWELKLTASKRGWYLLTAPSLMIGDPFGFFQERKEVNADAVELIVYPQIFPINVPCLPLRKLIGDIIDRNGLIKDPVFFAGTREYQYGRPAKYISWKATARYNIFQEKIFESSINLEVLFLIDVLSFKGKENYFEKMLELAASLAVQLDKEGISFGLISNAFIAGKLEKESVYLAPARSTEHLSIFLELLARLKMNSSYKIEELLEKETNIQAGITCLNFTYSSGEEGLLIKEFLKEKGIAVVDIICQVNNDIVKRTDTFYLLKEFLPVYNNPEINDYQKEGTI
jgi:uncharacterized protein (DUF58 family)